MIKFSGVSKQFVGMTGRAVDDLCFEIQEGEFLILLGESGCGKSTTLKMMNRLIDPTDGEIELNGKLLKDYNPIELRRSIGYVLQRIGLFPHMTIEENMMIVPRLLQWPKTKMEARLNELFELIALPADEFKNRYPRELSGGQQQRIGVARGLAANSKILLMDEPFGALDPITRDQIQQDVLRIRKNLNLTIVMVTHDMTEALLMADRIAVMMQGKLVRLGTPRELLNNPDHDYVRALMDTPSRHADIVEEMKSN